MFLTDILYGSDNVIECPNCGKSVRNGFAHCRFCGSEMNGEHLGDFTTDMLNVFKIGDEYLYLFSQKGNQVILQAGSIDELASLVEERKYPWEFRDWKGNVGHTKRKTVEIPKFESEFLKASSLKAPEIIPTASAKRKKEEDESYVPEYEVEEVVDKSDSSESVENGNGLQAGMDYVINVEDVGFGRRRDCHFWGPMHVGWGPDTSQRARELRASIFR